jgi:putative ABC transport system substrate-binding protein
MIASRRALLHALAAGAAMPAARAQARPFRIFMILFRGWDEACDGFRDYLASRRVAVDLIIRDLGQDLRRVPGIVAEAHGLKPDLVYLWGTSTAIQVLGPWDRHEPGRHLTGIPAVFNIVANPVGNKVVRSAEAPGRPVTGTEYIAPVDVQLRAMAAYRGFRRVAAIYNPREQNSVSVVAQIRDAATATGFALDDLPLPLRADGMPDPDAIPARVAEARRGGADWLYIPPDSLLNEHRHVLTESATAQGLPSFAATERFVLFSGGLAGLVGRYYSVGAFTGFKAELILTGARRAEEIPVEGLKRFSYMIRMETARRLGVFPPVGLLRVAEPV